MSAFLIVSGVALVLLLVIPRLMADDARRDGEASKQAELLEMAAWVAHLSRTCSEMRHALIGEGWTVEETVTAWGEIGSQCVFVEYPREQCVMVTAVFDSRHQCVGLAGYGYRLEACNDSGRWTLSLVDTRDGETVAEIAWPETWPERVGLNFLSDRGFVIV